MNGGGGISPEPNEEGRNDAVCCKDNGHGMRYYGQKNQILRNFCKEKIKAFNL
jgi:hypothetical protein